MFFMSSSMVFMILYVWSKRNPSTPASLWGFRMEARYLPFAFMALGMLMGNSIVPDVVGLLAGHVYYFIQEVLPETESPMRGWKLLRTPAFLTSLLGVMPSDTLLRPGQGYTEPQPETRRFTGRGHTLGSG
jgi:Derlin-2/3